MTLKPTQVAFWTNLIPTTGTTGQQWLNGYAVALLKSDGTVVTFGQAGNGGDSSAVAAQLTSVTELFSSSWAFAALKSDGTVVTWGNNNYGADSSTVSASLTNVVDISSTQNAFAALKSDGSVVTWGDTANGGDSSTVTASLASGVSEIYCTSSAFAALKTDGSVVTWGNTGTGGDSSTVTASLTSGVGAIHSTLTAFAALKTDGSVVTWGDSNGGDSSTVSASLTSGVSAIHSNMNAFAALKTDGSVVAWGNGTNGGDTSTVSAALSSGVVQVIASGAAFAARKSDGSVVSWGNSFNGGDSSGVSASLASGVVSVVATTFAFAALKSDGSVVAWGHNSLGGNASAVSASLASGVTALFSTLGAFAALKSDGTVVTWGSASYGANSSAVSAQLTSVTALSSNGTTFVALKSDGSVVTWGSQSSAGVASSLTDGFSDLSLSTAAICFLRGTLILTDRGEVGVEDLREGDLVATRFGGLRPIRWIGTQSFDARFAGRANTPVRLAPGSLGHGIPRAPLFVSPGHAVLLQGGPAGEVLAHAGALLNGDTITQPPATGTIDYFHLDLAGHDCVLAHGAWAESYFDDRNRHAFHNASGFHASGPGHAPVRQDTCLPILAAGHPALPAIRERLLPAPAALQLLADGRPLALEQIAPGTWRATIPAGLARLRLRSPAIRPPGEARTLGLMVDALARDGIPLPAQGEGWHAGEPAWTWTDGNAELPPAPGLLTLHGWWPGQEARAAA